MLANKKVTVVLPAYNAAHTLKQTFDEIPHDIVDDFILIGDASHDATVKMARNACGMPRRWSRASVVRVFRPRLSVSSTGQSSHILIRCSTRRSTTRRATDFRRSECGMLPK